MVNLMMKATHRVVCALRLPTAIGLLVSFVRAVILAMTGNPHFPSPSPPLATVDAALSALEKAQAAVAARVKGSVEQRDASRAALVVLLDTLRTYVQGVGDANPAIAAEIIQSAGFSVRKTGAPHKRVFSAVQGTTPGSIKVVAPSAANRASYDWEYSVDGGKTWQLAPSTLQAKTVITGFATGSIVSLRYRGTTKTGEGEWSPVISVVVR